MNALRNVLIIGATSTIAEQAARQLVAHGANVFCVGRDAEKLATITQDLQVRAPQATIGSKAMDLCDDKAHEPMLEEARAALGSLDAVLIAHGTLPDQKACEKSVATTRQEIETNAPSVISLLTLLGNRFEYQGGGVIAVISSAAGDRGRQSNYVYGSAKGMVTIFLQGLRNRLYKNGTDVVTIKPGFVDTPMTDGLDKSGPLWAKPDTIAMGIIKAMRKGRQEVYLPWFWWGIMQIIRNIPEFIFKRLSL